MRGPVQRLLSVVVLVTWMTPGPVALGVGLHLTDHDGHHGREQRHEHGVHAAGHQGRQGHQHARQEHQVHPSQGHRHRHGHTAHEQPVHDHQARGQDGSRNGSGDTRSDLLQAALHGHHHGVGDAPEHHHDAIPRSPAPVVRPLSFPLAVVPAATSAAPLILGQARRCDRPPGLGPPAPLFHTHCSLLL